MKRVGSVAAGLVVSIVVIGAVQWTNFLIYPPPDNVNFEDPAQVESVIANLPLGAFVMLELSYALGSFVGGLVAARIHTMRSALVVGVVLTVLGVVNLMNVPHPLWLAVVTTLTYVPCAGVGGKLGTRSV